MGVASTRVPAGSWILRTPMELDGCRTTQETSRMSSLVSPPQWEPTAAGTSTSCSRFALLSICNSDFSMAMTQIGSAIAKPMTAGCVPYLLKDTDANTPGTQPGCQAVERTPCDLPGQGDCLASGFREASMIECKDASGNTLDPANAEPSSVPDTDAGRPCWYLWYDANPVTGCPDAPKNQRISVLRRQGDVAPGGTFLAMNCTTCASSDPACAAAGP